jgi:hypothetical protein
VQLELVTYFAERAGTPAEPGDGAGKGALAARKAG